MRERIVDFAGVLRRNGLKATLSEELDALEAAGLLSLDDREIFKTALRSSLVKRAADVSAFDELFELYFSGLGDLLGDGGGGSIVERLSREGEDEIAGSLLRVRAVLDKMGEEFAELTRFIMDGDRGRIEQLMRDAAEQAGVDGVQNILQVGLFANKIRRNLDLPRVGEDLEKLRSALGEAGLPAGVVERVSAMLHERVERLREALREMVRRRLELNNHDYLERFRQESLLSKNFFNMTREEIDRMKEVVRRLAERLKSAVLVKRKKAERGRLDVKRTFRYNTRYGGMPFHLVFDKRVVDRPEIMVLCDLSESVRNVSRFFLQFVYGVQEVFDRVRCFIFVAELGEATRIFKDHEVGEAVERVLGSEIINLWSHSNYGLALRIFHRDFLPAVTPRTHVIVIGDGRNNYNDPADWVLGEIRRRAKSLIWLNPESEGSWGFGDSEMHRYRLHCSRAAECSNIRMLSAFIDGLVLSDLGRSGPR